MDDTNIVKLYHPNPKQIVKAYEKNKWVAVIRVQSVKGDNVIKLDAKNDFLMIRFFLIKDKFFSSLIIQYQTLRMLL